MRYQQSQLRVVGARVGYAGHGRVEQPDGGLIERGHQVRGGRRRYAVEQDAVTLYAARAGGVDQFGQRLVEECSEGCLGAGARQ